MMWDIASGILIASAILGIIFAGFYAAGVLHERGESVGCGLFLSLIGVALGAWVIVAHWKGW